MTNEELIHRARQAQEILASPIWVEAWDSLRARLFDVMENSKTDADALEARRRLHAATAVRMSLERIMSDGAVAAADIEAANKRPYAGLGEMLKDWVRY